MWGSGAQILWQRKAGHARAVLKASLTAIPGRADRGIVEKSSEPVDSSAINSQRRPKDCIPRE
jgi:hypothetical protein